MFETKKMTVVKNSFSKDELEALAEKNKSDKGMSQEKYNSSHWDWKGHFYTNAYEILFLPIKYTAKNIFEVGIGTNYTDVPSSMGELGVPGASLRMWKEYFPKANIYGADIDERILFEEDRIKTFYVDQLDPEVIAKMWSLMPQSFDLIIDDGLHRPDANITMLENSFHKLNKNGMYIIEDVSRYYFPELTKMLLDREIKFYQFSVDGDSSSFILIFKDHNKSFKKK
jgi:hypothetical protein